MTKYNFTFKELFSSAWKHTKDNAWFLFVMGLVTFIIMAAVHRTIILSNIVSLLMSISFIAVSLAIIEGKKPTNEDIFKSFRSYKIPLNYVLSSILYVLIVIGGFIALIIPGMYLAVRLSFYKFIVVENENMNTFDVLKKSMEITKGHFWKIFWFTIILFLLNMLGAMLFFVGLIITIPVSMLASTLLYKKLLPQDTAHPTH